MSAELGIYTWIPIVPFTIQRPVPYIIEDGTPPLLPVACTKQVEVKLSHVTLLLKVTAFANAPRTEAKT
jgi:hypothetical protein